MKSQTCVIIENDSVEGNDVKTLSAQVVERILTDLLRKIPIKDEFSGNMKEKSSEGMHTLQMFAGNCRDSTGKSECRDFKFRRIACIPAIPVILKSPLLFPL